MRLPASRVFRIRVLTSKVVFGSTVGSWLRSQRYAHMLYRKFWDLGSELLRHTIIFTRNFTVVCMVTLYPIHVYSRVSNELDHRCRKGKMVDGCQTKPAPTQVLELALDKRDDHQRHRFMEKTDLQIICMFVDLVEQLWGVWRIENVVVTIILPKYPAVPTMRYAHGSRL